MKYLKVQLRELTPRSELIFHQFWYDIWTYQIVPMLHLREYILSPSMCYYLIIPLRQCIHLNMLHSQNKNPCKTNEIIKVIYTLRKYRLLLFIEKKLCKSHGPKESLRSPQILTTLRSHPANNNGQVSNNIKILLRCRDIKPQCLLQPPITNTIVAR